MPLVSLAAPLTAQAQEQRALHPRSQVLAAFLCGFLAFLDLYCTQPLLPFLSQAFHASEASVGWTISASTLGVAVSAVLLAIFAERLDRKRTIVLAMVALGFTTLLTASAMDLPTLALCRLLQGLVTPGIFIITIAYLTEEWPAAQLPRIMSIYVGGTVFGGFLGRLTGGLLAEHFGWRSVFVVLGIAGLLGAAATNKVLRPAHKRPALPRPTSLLAPLAANLRSRRLLATFAIGFCMLFTLVSVFSYITFRLAAPPFGLSTSQLSSLFSVYLLGLAAVLAAGRVLTRIGLRYGMVGATCLCFAGVSLTLAPSLLVVGLGLSLASSGVFIAQTCANSFLREAAPDGRRVAAAGMYICSYYIGGTIGGVLPGLFWARAGWTGCVLLNCLLLAAAGVTAFYGWCPESAAA